MTGLPSPMVTLAKEHVGQDVAILAGGAWIEGTLVKVADDGQALRLESGAWVTFIDVVRIAAIRRPSGAQVPA